MPLCCSIKRPAVEVEVLLQAAIETGEPSHPDWQPYRTQHIRQPHPGAERKGTKLRVLVVEEGKARHPGQEGGETPGTGARKQHPGARTLTTQPEQKCQRALRATKYLPNGPKEIATADRLDRQAACRGKLERLCLRFGSDPYLPSVLSKPSDEGLKKEHVWGIFEVNPHPRPFDPLHGEISSSCYEPCRTATKRSYSARCHPSLARASA